MNSPAAFRSISSNTAETRLHGRWLVVARILWLSLVALALGLFAASLPTYFAYLHILSTSGNVGATLTANDVHELKTWGLSLDFFAWFKIMVSIIFLLVCISVGIVLFWRKSDDRMALLASLSLVLFPFVFNRAIVETLPPPWVLPTLCIEFIGNTCLGLFFYLFPGGLFVPRWTRWLALGWIIFWGLNLFSQFFADSFLSFVLFFGLLGSLVVVQIYHYRRISNPVERQQTKWVVFGMSIGFGLYVFGGVVLYALLPRLLPMSSLALELGQIPFSLLILLFPLSVGLAILRSRLWEIDLLINRTLVYGTLTVLLALLYTVLIIGLQFLLSSITSGSDFAIVGSTLAIAVLFQPLRRRIQQGIDRRFYRRKYDAAKTLAAFNATLRSEVDLDQLREELLAVVQKTMQPSHISLWLRPNASSSQHGVTWSNTPPAP